jgi:HNH endonuclease/AP2 domain
MKMEFNLAIKLKLYPKDKPAHLELKLDPEDEYLRAKCHIHSNGHGHNYAFLNARPHRRLHRVLTGCPKGSDVDHINGDTLDDRKSNLRVVSRQENQRNRVGPNRGSSSPFLGVSYNTRRKRWQARIKHNGRTIFLGSYNTPEEANMARLRKEKELYGIQPRRRPAFEAAGLA